MTGAPERDESVAVIRELVDGDIAAIRQSAAEASTSVSIVQRFTGAVSAIGDKLNAMARLAKKALDPDCTRLEAEEMQKEYAALSAEIEDVVQGTEYNYNRIFSGEGHTVSIPIGNGCWVDIFSRDLRFDAGGLDLASDAGAALSKVEGAIEALGEYGEGLRAQARRVEEATAMMESQAAAAMGVDLSDFGIGSAREVARYAASQVLADRGALLNAQANISPERGLQLLTVNS
jgi:flagellin-like hook-associated protein FlgL